MCPETMMLAADHERELMAALETESAQNEELEAWLVKLVKNRDGANRGRNEKMNMAGPLQEELNRVSARLRSKETECERLRSEVFACHKKCSNADIELEAHDTAKDEAARMESIVEACRHGRKFENLRSMYEANAHVTCAPNIRKLDSDVDKVDLTLANTRKKWGGVLDDMGLELNRERKDHDKEQACKAKKIDSVTNQLKRKRGIGVSYICGRSGCRGRGGKG